ncbi:MAG: hypothetical protein COB76_06655 [Alphaproteobacteria bacterium]|nr:MAG: hypothetical protein COB76_06655 [Alphaproteobacteria bacterium]
MNPWDEYSEMSFFDFRSYHPVDTSRIRHVVYMKRWQKLILEMGEYATSTTDGETITIDNSFVNIGSYDNFEIKKPLTMIHNILRHIPSTHTCRIASTFIHWIASDEEFSDDTRRLCMKLNADEEGREVIYQGVFNTMNQRDQMLNYGRIPLDSLTNEFRQQSDAHDMETVHKNAMQDIDTINMMIKWIASNEGQTFIQGCERNIKIKRTRENDKASRRMPKIQYWLSRRPHPFP